ncbi:hypothetical protein [Paenibacillus contaminans]|uniref:Holin n=1 Tax=Paenibacillus contaminans TaxID=450362 RepID=A0A329MG02_9BACL|nr:hypothetical protein [Paenibacillus contaminans]RAV18845.1 hypothetical protein DQG23_24250 [Paenibacillus contaminans]
MESQLFTWEALSAMGGASLLTFFIVQYTKKLMDRIAPGLPTDVYAVIVAFFVLIMAQLAVGANAADWRVYGLAFANAFLIAAAAGQMQYKAIRPPGKDEIKNG